MIFIPSLSAEEEVWAQGSKAISDGIIIVTHNISGLTVSSSSSKTKLAVPPAIIWWDAFLGIRHDILMIVLLLP